MKIPNADRAVADIEKLRDYSLNPEHPSGQHKARLFAVLLGLTILDSQELKEKLLIIVVTEEATLTKEDKHGRHYVIDFEMNRVGKKANVRSSWIIRPDEDFPRLTSCYIVRKKGKQA